MREFAHRIKPYYGIGGEYIFQADFILKAARTIDSEFNPPLEWSDHELERIPHKRDVIHFKMGDSKRGIEVTRKIEYEPISATHALDEVIVESYGLSDEREIRLTMHLSSNDQEYIELQFHGNEEEFQQILEGFRLVFEEPDEDQKQLGVCKKATKLGAWRAVEFNALEYLKSNPNDPEALMYLGIARGEQGFEPEGENLLLTSLTFNPNNHHAYYHLGLLVMKQGRKILASNCFNKGLEYKPEHHSLLYHLGRAHELMNSNEDAIRMYEKALENIPINEDPWADSIDDFSDEARIAIMRIQQKLDGTN